MLFLIKDKIFCTFRVVIDLNSIHFFFLIGFSHRPEYHLFRLGEEASLAVKEFAEKASTEVLDKQKTQITAEAKFENAKTEDFIVLDGINGPPIESGVGTSQATLFLDGNHTKVNKIINNKCSN